MEIPPPPRAGSGHFRITLHDPERWAEPRAAPLPWLPLTMVFDLPHLRASLLAEPGAERREGLFMLDTGAQQRDGTPRPEPARDPCAHHNVNPPACLRLC